ncbi:MAG TPA: quinolinate synthase NadA [Spirochaetota bacterium]|jgi:quinolinate synthase|nr:quinolinate synthase NadA [Spirochaetota bacterium]OPZ35292.1 MAG: Quinolinate synthase A [Spirochaetes bacterium ADurb.BinA120]HNU91676.1 quinolinate synthase NadA [Spirochaetota bacterium]HPO45348.1 quinolinate synthase NadA [Spirochaetota bacterium]HPV98300.1 quinolinate synthase NadA [Spirochaetota bacterium]
MITTAKRTEALAAEIKSLAARKNALILAHNYQREEVQAVADYTGDSLELARIAADTAADIIVFCGVHFMAESAAILNPGKKVLLPDPTAGCPMADMAGPEDLAAMRERNPDASVVTYINSSAEVKALSDVCCTSANAVKIVQRVDARRVIFVPDRNLGSWVQRFTDKEVILWDGFCPTHERFTAADLAEAKRLHPDALVMVHPECNPEVIDMADEVLSTGQMVKFVRETDRAKIIVGTEEGMIHKLKSVAPEREYILPSKALVCPNMKKTTLEKVHAALVNEGPIVTVDPEVREKSLGCLRRMLKLS